VLVGNQSLLHRRQFDVQVKVRQKKIRRERFDDTAVITVPEWECTRLVLPADAVEVEEPRELFFALVGETRILQRARWRRPCLERPSVHHPGAVIPCTMFCMADST
jgi:hypothetical protein